MITKTVPASADICTVTAGAEITKVKFETECSFIQIRHISGEILCGKTPAVADGADGTVKLTSGGFVFSVASPVICIGGNGVCEVYAANSAVPVFKSASGGGGDGVKVGILEMSGIFAEQIIGGIDEEV